MPAVGFPPACPYGLSRPRPLKLEPGSSGMVVLAQDEVRREIAGGPRLQESWCLGTDLFELVAEPCSFNGVEKHSGHAGGV